MNEANKILLAYCATLNAHNFFQVSKNGKKSPQDMQKLRAKVNTKVKK